MDHSSPDLDANGPDGKAWKKSSTDRSQRNSGLITYDRRQAIYFETEPTPPVIKLNVVVKGAAEKRANITQPVKCSPAFLVEEIVEQIVVLFVYMGHLKSDDEAHRKYLNYALYKNNEYLHKDKSAMELKLEEGQTVELRYVPQQSVLVKVFIPQFTPATPPSATFKVTQFTPVRSALKRLFLRFHEQDVTSFCIATVPAGNPQDPGVALDQDSFLHVLDDTIKFVYRRIRDDEEAKRSLTLKVVLRVDPTGEYKRVSMTFDPNELVAKSVRQLDIVAGALDNFAHCGLFVTPDEYEEKGGFWLREDMPLSFYQIRTQDLVEYRPRYRTYKIILPDGRYMYHKFDEFAAVDACLEIIKFNEAGNIKGNLEDFGLYVGPTLLEGPRTLWSYEGAKDLVFKEHSHPVTIFTQETGQDTLLVDFNVPVEKIFSDIVKKFGISEEDILRIVLRKFLTGGELEKTKTLRQQAVKPGDGLLLRIEYKTGEEDKQPGKLARATGADEKPDPSDCNIWDEPRTPDHMVYEGETIEAGTLNKLVERLTSETTHDLDFMKAFLMTYLSFTTPQRLLNKLFERFRVPDSMEPTKKLSIQLRVCNVIKNWVEHHHQDFGHGLTQTLIGFVDGEVGEILPQAARQVRGAILKRTCDIKTTVIRKIEDAQTDDKLEKSPPPSPVVAGTPPLSSSPSPSSMLVGTPPTARIITASPPALPPRPSNLEKATSLPDLRPRKAPQMGSTPPKKTLVSDPRTKSSFDLWRSKKVGRSTLSVRASNNISIWEFEEEDIAQQLTLLEFDMFVAIKPSEMLNQSWNRPALQNRSPNILAMISRFNEIGLWVCHQILQADRLRQRIKRMEKLIKVAEHLRSYNNFSTLMAFLGGMNNSAILRLKYTKQGLPKRSQEVLEQLEKEMSSEGSYKEYRAALRAATPPLIPYMVKRHVVIVFGPTVRGQNEIHSKLIHFYSGVNLSDLVFIDEGNPDRVANNLINFSKYQLIYKVIEYLQQFKSNQYSQFTPLPPVLSFFRNFSLPTEKELYGVSLQREPRGAAKNEIL